MKNKILLITIAFLISGTSLAAQITDKDGNTYKTVTIGTQTWMAENLNVGHFRNGDLIPEARTNEEWEKADKEGKPAWCYYDNDLANNKKYGKLYNWHVVIDPRGLAPVGSHISSDAEWTTLTNYIGYADHTRKMKATSGWNHDDGNGTNESGFTGLPGGMRSYYGAFSYQGNYAYWWSSTESRSEGPGYSRGLYYSNGNDLSRDWSNGKGSGLSIRCLRD